MKLSVNYNDLKDIGKDVDNTHDALDAKFNEILQLLKEVENNWEGNDATVFLAKANYYVEKEKIDNERVKDVGTILDKVSGRYKGNDEEFDNQIKKESVIDERRA